MAKEKDTEMEKPTIEEVMKALVLALHEDCTVWLEHDMRELLGRHGIGAQDE